MARGQKEAANKQLATTNAIGAGNNQEAGNIEKSLVPGYTSLMSTGYMDPAEEAAATTSEMGAATAPFKSAEFQAANRAGATRNASDLTAQQDQLALEEGQTAGMAAADLQKQKLANQEAGMYGLAGQEAGNRQETEAMYGLGPGTLGARAAGGGWTQGFKDVAGVFTGGGGGGGGGYGG